MILTAILGKQKSTFKQKKGLIRSVFVQAHPFRQHAPRPMAALRERTTMNAMEVALQNTKNELEDDDELKDKDVPALAAFMRLAMTSKQLYRVVRS